MLYTYPFTNIILVFGYAKSFLLSRQFEKAIVALDFLNFMKFFCQYELLLAEKACQVKIRCLLKVFPMEDTIDYMVHADIFVLSSYCLLGCK